MFTIAIVVIAAASLFAAVLNLSTESRFKKRVKNVFFTLSLLFGLLLYGYGYSYVSESIPIAVIHTIMSVCQMFAGANDLGAIQEAPLFSLNWGILVFWLMHFMAFYVTADVAATTLGSKLLRRIRIALSRRGTLLLIYGINDNSLAYGKMHSRDLRRSVVFIGRATPAQESAINNVGSVLEKTNDQPDAALLRRFGIRPGKRHIEVAVLHEDGAKNLDFSRKLLETFKKAGILTDQTTLLMRNVDEDLACSLIASKNTYGYGSVMAFDEYKLAARLMVQKLPPCETIRFDNNARAQEDFGVLMVGFGQMGRAALNALVMNGQFCGSTFHADIFDPNPQNGALYDHEILKQYTIRFHKSNGRSEAIYAFLSERKNSIHYIVVCTGDEKTNNEIASDLRHWLLERGSKPLIVQCTERGIVFGQPGETDYMRHNIYGSDALDIERIDRMAMAINHAYCRSSGKTAQENWKHCDYFSRMSSRASADFYPALLTASGKTALQAETGDWPPHSEALENLAISEHLRWCAFHYVMGFRPMSESEYSQRAARYQMDIQEKGASSLRISKDMQNKKHACLIPWEELDQLSAQENAVTGGHVDYKQMDRNNILALPDILASLREMQKK
ncbi:MAG: hypothetical protein E7335_03015 [Clostridiales bacterium]|nr:hypothetical protein [Clostridiales bacterium]